MKRDRKILLPIAGGFTRCSIGEEKYFSPELLCPEALALVEAEAIEQLRKTGIQATPLPREERRYFAVFRPAILIGGCLVFLFFKRKLFRRGRDGKLYLSFPPEVVGWETRGGQRQFGVTVFDRTGTPVLVCDRDYEEGEVSG